MKISELIKWLIYSCIFYTILTVSNKIGGASSGDIATSLILGFFAGLINNLRQQK